MHYFFIALAFFFSSIILEARPAFTGLKTITQMDGTEILIREHGDEFYYYYTSEDSLLIVQDSTGLFFFANEEGEASSVKVRTKNKRGASETSKIKKINQKKSRKAHQQKRQKRFQKPEKQSPTSLQAPPLIERPVNEAWTIGERRFPVILLSTKDKNAMDSALFHRFFNESGFSEDKNIGSLRDYFLVSSDSLFQPHFDIFPIHLDKQLSDYVSDNQKLMEGKLIADALDILTARKDFDGNKYCANKINVDGFLFLFPGREVDATQLSEDFWAHQYWMQYNGSNPNHRAYVSNGFSFNKYILSAQEGNKINSLNQLGIFVHEFSHVLGLKDHYAYDDQNNFIAGPSPWDVMTQGMYNGNGRLPPKFSAFERESVGWMNLTELSTDKEEFSLPAIDKMKAYSITNPKDVNEYFIVEYRPPTNFDSGIEETGVLVWYIHYNNQIWANNNPNKDPLHPRVNVQKVLLGNKKPIDFYAPFEFVDKTSALVSGVHYFIKDNEESVCFTNDNQLQIEKCSSDMKASSSSTLTEPPSLSSSSADTPTYIVETLSKYKTTIRTHKNKVTLYTEVPGNKSLELFDLQGNLILKKEFQNTEVQIFVPQKNTYVLRLSVHGRAIEQKIWISK